MNKEKGEMLYGTKVDFEEAKKLANYTLIFNDLDFTEKVLRRLNLLLGKKCNDRFLIESLWIAATITYCRCFIKGKRIPLSEDIFKNKGLKGDPKGTHQFYINLRNKFIAHSVNPFEQVTVDLQLSDPKSKERKVVGISVLSQKLIFPGIEGIKTLLRLSLFAKEEVRKLANEYTTKTLEVGKKLPIESLYSKTRGVIVTPGPEKAGKAREE